MTDYEEVVRLREKLAALTAALEGLEQKVQMIRNCGNRQASPCTPCDHHLKDVADRLAALRTTPLWQCESCGRHVEPDPTTPQGRGHQVPNADGSPGYCGPVSLAALRTPEAQP